MGRFAFVKHACVFDQVTRFHLFCSQWNCFPSVHKWEKTCEVQLPRSLISSFLLTTRLPRFHILAAYRCLLCQLSNMVRRKRFWTRVSSIKLRLLLSCPALWQQGVYITLRSSVLQWLQKTWRTNWAYSGCMNISFSLNLEHFFSNSALHAGPFLCAHNMH